MPEVTPLSRANIVRLFTIPTKPKDAKGREFLKDITIRIHRAERWEMAVQGPGFPTAIWWEGMTLCAAVKVPSFSKPDHLEFLHKGNPVWIVALEPTENMLFTFKQTFSVSNPSTAWLAG